MKTADVTIKTINKIVAKKVPAKRKVKKITKEKPTPSTPDNEYMKMCFLYFAIQNMYSIRDSTYVPM